jgi:hypothetical protein
MGGPSEIKGNVNLAYVIEKQLGVDIPGMADDGSPYMPEESLTITTDGDRIVLNSGHGRKYDVYSNGNISHPVDVMDALAASVPTASTSAEDPLLQTGVNFTGRMVGNALFNMTIADTTPHKAKKLIKALEYLAGDQTGKIPFGCKALVESLQTAIGKDNRQENPAFSFSPKGVGLSFQF